MLTFLSCAFIGAACGYLAYDCHEYAKTQRRWREFKRKHAALKRQQEQGD